MIDLVATVYYGIFTVFFIFIILFIAYNFLRKLHDILFPDEVVKKGYILVTGCDTGFGNAAALEFNRRNLFVFATCLTTQGVEKFNQDENFNGMSFIMDITKKEDIDNARNIIEDKVGEEGLWCLINNAGVAGLGPIEWAREEDMKRTMEINLWGAVNVTKAMIPLVKKAGGRIVNMTSMAGRVSIADVSSYCMAKYALEAFSDSLRHEMRPWGVSVHIIEPGYHRTNMFAGLEKRWKDLWELQPNDIKDAYGENFLKDVIAGFKAKGKMCGDPKNVAQAYLHAALSSRPQLRYVVGRDANTVLMAIATLPSEMGDTLYRMVLKHPIPEGTKRKQK